MIGNVDEVWSITGVDSVSMFGSMSFYNIDNLGGRRGD